MTRPTVDRNGFTLLELVIGITITGMAVSAGYAALAMVMDRRQLADERVNAAIQVANVRRTLRSWLGEAHLTIEDGGPVFSGLDGVEGTLPDDALSFMTGSETPLGRDVMFRIFIDHDPNTAEAGLVAEFQEWRGPRTRLLTLDPRVESLDIRYYGAVMKDRDWLPSWISRTLLPNAVEVTLAGDSLPDLLRLPIFVPLGANR